MRPLSLLSLLATATSAQHIIPDLSFGHASTLSPNGRGLPNWAVSSSNHHVQILSDRIILTPPVPGNARGALWTENPIDSETWSAEIDFRASGQDTGSGNLQFWFVKDKKAVNIDSVYTVGTFDGLTLVIDQYGGHGGGIRGFLNDGSQNFKAHSSLESLAFGHCDYSYRNLGRLSKLRVTSNNGLRVQIDDQECFSSDKISLPSGYYFGLTAGTADQPDSFEINKFIVTGSIPHTHENVVKGGAPPIQRQEQQEQPPTLQRLDKLPGLPEFLPDRMAEEVKGQEDQFADLHNRIQGLTHQIANMFWEFERLGQRFEETVRQTEERHYQIMAGVQQQANAGQAQELAGKLDALGRRIENIERNVEQVKRDVEGKDYREHLSSLNQAIENVRTSLPETSESLGRLISASAPRMGMFVFIVLAVQIMMAGAYVVYKRRRASMPKKYL